MVYIELQIPMNGRGRLVNCQHVCDYDSYNDILIYASRFPAIRVQFALLCDSLLPEKVILGLGLCIYLHIYDLFACAREGAQVWCGHVQVCPSLTPIIIVMLMCICNTILHYISFFFS